MEGREDHATGSSSIAGGESMITDYGRNRSSCGYCKSSGRNSITHGLLAHNLKVDDYQELLDRGWRRSGSYLYKPDMKRTCCPSYTISLKVDDFIPSKEQVRVRRKMQRFLDGTLSLKKTNSREGGPVISKTSSIASSSQSPNVSLNTLGKESSTRPSEFPLVWDQCESETNVSCKVDSAVSACIECGVLPSGMDIPRPTVKKVTPQMKKKLQDTGKDILYTSNIAFQIIASMKRALSVEKEMSPTYIAEKLAESMHQQEHFSGLLVLACNGHLNFYSKRKENVLEAPSDNSVQSFKDNTSNPKRKCLLNEKELLPCKRERLEIRTKRSSFDPEEYDLYRRYQTKVHNDKPEHLVQSAYNRFLVDTPLIFVPPSGDGSTPPCGFGSFHQQYLVDGKLVAVGVVDVLPRCLSSKYLFWDPDFASLSLGKYSALQEINWVKLAQISCPSMQYYYLGYYIHTCGKMRYKASYSPSELLCPLRYQWVPFQIAKPLLDKKPYVILSDFIGMESLNTLPCDSEDVSKQQCLRPGKDEDEAMYDGGEELEAEFYSSDSGPDNESDVETTSDENGDISETKIGLSNTSMQFKDLVKALGPNKRRLVDSLERQLRIYRRVVGPSLSRNMIYSLD